MAKETSAENQYRILENWKLSMQEFRKLRVIVFCGMMGALAIVLSYAGTIRIGPYMRIGLSGVPGLVVDFSFGPGVGAIFDASMDVIKYFLNPDGAFFPGFTLSAILRGVIYGSFLYRRKISFIRVLIPEIIDKTFINVGLNTLWLNILYVKGFLALLPNRIILNLVELPLDTIVAYLILKTVERTILKEFRNDAEPREMVGNE